MQVKCLRIVFDEQAYVGLGFVTMFPAVCCEDGGTERGKYLRLSRKRLSTQRSSLQVIRVVYL